MFTRFSVLILLLIGIVFSDATIQSQSSLIASGQELRYIRQETESLSEYIGLSSSARQVYTLPQSPDCWAVSTKGTYIALSSLEEPISLIIQRISTSDNILQTGWQANWRPCSMIWLTDSAIGIARSDTFNVGLIYEVTPGMLTPIDYIPGQPPPLPELPEQLLVSVIPEFVLRSPQPNIFLYQRCVGQTFTGEGQQLCPGGVNAVIYDSASQTVLAQLERSASDISGFDIILERRSGGLGAAWSADGNYLAYRYVPDTMYRKFDLAIRDLTLNQDLNLSFPNEYVVYSLGISWGPTGHKLIFWLRGRLGEDEIGDSDDTTRHPIIFDANMQRFVEADRPYEFPTNYPSDPVMWASDGKGLVFIDGSNNLIHLDSQTGVTTLLDTNVSRIIDWVELSQTASCTATIPASDVPALIAAINTANAASTPQTLCLESSTYTLTAADNSDWDGDNGLPSITGDITIVGDGSTITRDGAAPAIRLFHVAAGGTLNLENMTLTGGSLPDPALDAGAVYNRGTLALDTVTLSGHDAGNDGGAVSSVGTLTITDSTFSNNQAGDDGGAVSTQNGTTTITTFDGNSAPDGGAVDVDVGGVVTINGGMMSNNTASNDGAMHVYDTDLTVTGMEQYASGGQPTFPYNP